MATVFSAVERMNPKGVVLNAAFAVSASFALGSHLAFTMAYGSPYLWPMIIGKFISGVCAVAVALLLYKEKKGANKLRRRHFRLFFRLNDFLLFLI